MSEYVLTPQELAFGRLLTKALPAAYTGKITAADQRGSHDAAPFATFKFDTDTEKYATPVTCLTNTPGTADPTRFVNQSSMLREVFVSVNVVGPTAYADLRDALLKIRASPLVEESRAEGITVRVSEQVRRIPYTALQSRQNRAQIDVRVHYMHTADVSEVPAIETACGTVAGVDTQYDL